MLADLLSEVRRRRLWPIALVALLVAVGAPLLFLEPAAPDAPSASALAPPPAAAGRLPARAERLLATSDATTSEKRRSGKSGDPFRAPASRGGSSTADATSKAAASSGKETTTDAAGADAAPRVTDPIPVVITNGDGSERTSPAQPIGDESATSTSTPAGTRSVDVRWGARMPARLYRAIPRLQTFVAGGRVVAIFVKYSPKRDKAVFAIAPKTLVRGEIDCRRKAGVCRYVDIPAGRGVRLTTVGTDGSLVTRRLDVERVKRVSRSGAAAASTSPGNGACLLGKLLRLEADDMPLASDACPS